MALIRFPGSKAKLAPQIVSHFPPEMSLPLWMNSNAWEYREPFFGAGAIGFRILEKLPPSCGAWINDKDYGLVCLWQAVWNDPLRLGNKIESFSPSTKAFYRFKEEDGRTDLDPLEIGFRKLALHQMSYSGLGPKSGGPLGGRNQDNSQYRIDCRWNPSKLTNEIDRLNEIMKRVPNLKITCRDFSELIDGNPKVFLYLDPPYFEKGSVLYKFDMTVSDHERLSAALAKTKNSWVLSYDDHPFIRNLYDGACVHELTAVYTIANGNRPKNKEILITPRRYAGT